MGISAAAATEDGGASGSGHCERDLTIAMEKVTPEAINFMARYGRGLMCLSLTAEQTGALRLPLMVRETCSGFGTAFTLPIDARRGSTRSSTTAFLNDLR